MNKGKLAIAAVLATVLFVMSFSVFASKETSSKADVNFLPGDIQLESAPSIKFGTHKLSVETATYSSEAIVTPVKLVDTRGSANGWNLRLRVGDMSYGTQKINAGILQFTAGDPTTTDSRSAPPTPANINGLVKIRIGDTMNHPVWVAKGLAGMGKWEMEIDGTASITVPPGTVTIAKGTTANTYKGELSWTLTDAP